MWRQERAGSKAFQPRGWLVNVGRTCYTSSEVSALPSDEEWEPSHSSMFHEPARQADLTATVGAPTGVLRIAWASAMRKTQ